MKAFILFLAMFSALAVVLLTFQLAKADISIPSLSNHSGTSSITVQGLDKHSNHFKFCEKLTDKKTRSIICPDVWSSNETGFTPGG